ncbi:tol-pal system protein YbgF [Terricaulis sp.]|uniref:tol-pal system protein YbgF n=1 Tax=Terricaulis sp. TaxID=2768686 RepID=UPI003783DEE4
MKRTPFVTRGQLAACIAAAGLFALPAAAVAQTQLPPPQTYGQAETRQDRLEELEGQLRDATAENERLQYQLQQANREITRLRAMVGDLAAANQSLGQSETPPADAAAPPQQPQSPPPQQRSEGGSSGLNAAQERAVGTLGTMPATQAPPQRAASTEPLPEPGPLYSRARELLNNGRLAEAEEAFAQFLEAYPTAETAPDARYWYAYTLLARNNYQSAATSFVDYLRRYPTGARAPDAQVRLGMALAGLGDRRRACAAWADIPTRYPRAPQRVRDDAQREMRASQCAA